MSDQIIDKKKIAKYATAAAVTTGVAVALPAATLYFAPTIATLVAGMLSAKVAEEVGKSSLSTISGILGGIATSAIWEIPRAKKELNQNHDLLKLLAKAYFKSADEMLNEIKANPKLTEKYGTNAESILEIIKKRINEGISSKDSDDWEKLFPLQEFLETQNAENKEPDKVPFLLKLFSFSPKEDVPINKELAAKMSSEDFILNMADDPETSRNILAREVEITVKRWHFEKTPEKYELNHSIKKDFYQNLAELIPKFTGTLVKEKGNEKSWLAFQRSHLQAILTEVKANKGLSEEDRILLKPLAKKLDEWAESDFPKQLADSTSTILSHLDKSEESIKQCVKDETTKLQDYLVGMESRIRDDIEEVKGDIGEAKDEIIERIDNISPEKTLPNSIPQSVGFVGRETYLNEIRQQYQNGTRIFVLHGIGGVGKSALALAFASEIKEEYQAKIFVDMQGLNENPLSARDAMFDVVVREFKEQIPTDTPDSQLLKVFNSIIQNQPTLIVLDNAKNIDSVKSLINADNACFIITSRKRIYLGEETFETLKMSEADAVKLLSDKGGYKRFSELTEEFANECGYLPQALKVIKGLMMTKRLLRADDFLEKFKAEKLTYLDEVTASLNLSYEIIGEELQTLWRKLGVFPADFDSAACAAVWNLDIETAETKLGELDSYSLIEVNLETRRFNLHDLAREFCDSKISEDERFDIQFFFAKHYTAVLWECRSIKERGGENAFLNSLNVIDLEWINIIEGQKWSAENYLNNDEVALLCIGYSGIFRDIVLRLHPQTSILWLKVGLKASQKLGNHQNEGKYLTNLGNAYQVLGKHKKATKFYEQALHISKGTGDYQVEISSLSGLGIISTISSEYEKAIKYHKQALRISKRIGDRQSEGGSLGNLGNVYNILEEYKKAIKYHKQALNISKDTNDLYREGNHSGNLGNSYQNLGKYKEALKFYKIALKISREIGNRHGEGISLENLGLAYLKLSNDKRACDLWEKALVVFEAIESPNASNIRQLLKENNCNLFRD